MDALLSQLLRPAASDLHRLSPTGSVLAFASSGQAGARIRCLRTGERPARTIACFEGTATQLAFLDEHHLLCVVAAADGRRDTLWRVPLLGGPPSELAGGGRLRLISEHGPDVSWVARSPVSGGGAARQSELHRLQTAAGALERVACGPPNLRRWLASRDGRVVMAVVDVDGGTALLRATRLGDATAPAFEEVVRAELPDELEPVGLSRDGAVVWLLSNVGRDRRAALALDWRSGAQRMLYEHPRVDVDGLRPPGGEPELAVSADGRPRLHPLTAKAARDLDLLERICGDHALEIEDCDSRGESWVVRLVDDRSHGRVAVFRRGGATLQPIIDRSPWLDRARGCAVEAVRISSRDGLALPSFLTRAAGHHAGPPAAVLRIHGGPWERDRWGFDPAVQALATAGLTVLQVDFRGSTGHGKRFWWRSAGEWGGGMQHDLIDAARWLVERGMTTPGRIALWGASYGGYAALMAPILEPSLFSCAVAASGIYDLPSFAEELGRRWDGRYLALLRRLIGDPKTDRRRLAEASPLHRAAELKIPLLLVHGPADARIPVRQSRRMIEALRENGATLDVLELPGDGHRLGPADRKRYYETALAFLRQHRHRRPTAGLRPAAAIQQGFEEDGVRHLERRVIECYRGESISGGQGASGWRIPERADELPELYRRHVSMTQAAVPRPRDRHGYAEWLRTVPYAMAQREIRGELRRLIRGRLQARQARPPALGHASELAVVMSDHRWRLRRGGAIGFDILVRRPLPPGAGSGARHHLAVGRRCIVLTLHGSFRDFCHRSGLHDAWLRFACQELLYRRYQAWMDSLRGPLAPGPLAVQLAASRYQDAAELLLAGLRNAVRRAAEPDRVRQRETAVVEEAREPAPGLAEDLDRQR